MTIELFLDVLSSWCHLAEPAWARLRATYEGRVDFVWSIALVERADALGYSAETMDWYYRRTARMTGERLNAAWIEGPQTGTVNANRVAAAARALGVADDRVWTALARAAMREGRNVGRLEEAVAVAAAAADLDASALRALATGEAIDEHVRDSTGRFRAFGFPQLPTFLISDDIGDQAAISGVIRYDALAAVIDAMLADTDGFRAYMLGASPEPARH